MRKEIDEMRREVDRIKKRIVGEEIIEKIRELEDEVYEEEDE